MHERPRIAIDTTAPSCTWIDELLEDIVRFGGDMEDIAWFCKMLKENGYKDQEGISRKYGHLRKTAEIVLLPVIHPDHYKWYLGSLTDYAQLLAEDDRCVVVYDHTGLPESSADHRHVATKMSVEIVLERWRKRHGQGRILTKEKAIVRIVELTKSIRTAA